MTEPPVLVRITNSYACGRMSKTRTLVPGPELGDDLEVWFEVMVHPLTGDGHPCGSREHAYYDAEIIAAPPRRRELVGKTCTWEG